MRDSDVIEDGSAHRRDRSWLVAASGVALAATVGIDAPVVSSCSRAVIVIAATVVITRSRRSVTRSVAELVFGLVALIAGVGIGPHHATIDATAAQSIGGIAAIVTGAALTSFSTLALVRRMRRWYKLLAIPVAVGVLVGAVLPATLAVFVTNAPDFELGEQTPGDHGFDYDDVTVSTDDGVDLAGWYVASRNGAAVIVLGGATGARDDELEHGSVLAEHGYGVLWLDVRGHGGSEGDAMLWGWWGEDDVRAGVDFLTGRPDVQPDRIGVMGMSMGAEEAIGAAGEDDRIRAVIAEGATARGARDEGDTSEGLGGFLVRYIDWTTKNAAAMMTSADTPTHLRAAAAAMPGRHLLLIAAGTRPAEIAAAAKIEAAAPDVVATWVVPGADHTKAYDLNPTEWERRVTDFLGSSLTGSG